MSRLKISNEDITLALKEDVRSMEKITKYILDYMGNVYQTKYWDSTTKEEREDVLHDSTMKILKNLKSFRGDSEFGTWTYKIGNNMMLSYLTKRNKKIYVEINENLVAPDKVDIQVDKKDISGHVHEAIGELSPKLKPLILMRDLQGLTYDEISKKTGVGIGTVKSRINRGRTIVKQYFIKNKLAYN